MLWDIIYQFYVQYVFGGAINDEFYSVTLGDATWFYEGVTDDFGAINALDVGYVIKGFGDYDYGMSLGNYLSLIATIITLIVILLLSWKLIKAIFNICAKVI